MKRFRVAPVVDVAPLFSGDGATRAATARSIGDTLVRSGVIVAKGAPDAASIDKLAATMLRFFGLPLAEKLAVASRRTRPDSSHTYRGYVSTLEENRWAYNEFFDIGPEARRATYPPLRGAEIFAETNLWPQRAPTPGWRRAMLAYFTRMERLGTALIHALGGYLDLPRDEIAARFDEGNSTLRLLNYPPRPAGITPAEPRPEELCADGEQPELVAGRHTDGSALSLLWQGQPGLQGQAPDGTWQDVPMEPNTVSVHLGDMVEQLMEGRLRATPHRVIDQGGHRCSIGFFLEPKLEASCAPLSRATAAPSRPGGDSYAALLLRRFSRYKGYEHLVASPD